MLFAADEQPRKAAAPPPSDRVRRRRGPARRGSAKLAGGVVTAAERRALRATGCRPASIGSMASARFGIRGVESEAKLCAVFRALRRHSVCCRGKRAILNGARNPRIREPGAYSAPVLQTAGDELVIIVMANLVHGLSEGLSLELSAGFQCFIPGERS